MKRESTYQVVNQVARREERVPDHVLFEDRDNNNNMNYNP